MNSDLLKGLNEHLKLEFRAAHEYLAMSVWLSVNDLPGFSKWMKQQSAGELTHAQRIMDHLVDRDEQPVLPGIPAPPKTWKSLEALCQHVLKNEREVTASINELCAAADKAKDRAAAVMLQWFVTEQIEEEAAARAVLGRIRLAGSTGVGVLMVDQELASGTIPGAPAEPPAGGGGVTGRTRCATAGLLPLVRLRRLRGAWRQRWRLRVFRVDRAREHLQEVDDLPGLVGRQGAPELVLAHVAHGLVEARGVLPSWKYGPVFSMLRSDGTLKTLASAAFFVTFSRPGSVRAREYGFATPSFW